MDENTTISALAQWLAATRFSSTLTLWPPLIPLLQTIHIICVAIVMSSVSFYNLRVMGIFARQLPIGAVAARFLPWMWWTMPVILTTGILLITAEPARDLQNPTFWLKMLLLLGALSLTTAAYVGRDREGAIREGTIHTPRLRQLVAAVSIILWISIVFAGRMIAYTQSDS
jgi:hypothetical protein